MNRRTVNIAPFDKLRANGRGSPRLHTETINMIDECLAVIMAGGDSQRMGRDKASLVLGEQTLLQRVADALR